MGHVIQKLPPSSSQGSGNLIRKQKMLGTTSRNLASSTIMSSTTALPSN
jgi:hypothetical protein